MTIAPVNTTRLETERLVLRAPLPSDFGAMAPFVMSDRAQFVGGGADKDMTHAWRILAILTGHWALRGFGVFVFENKTTGELIGSGGPWYPAGWPEKELSWTLWSPEAEGKGYAFEAITRIRRHAYEDLGWQTAVSYIVPENIRSIALAKRLGCTEDSAAKGPDEEDIVFRHPNPAEVLA